jgi:hypothetical protein
MVHALAEVRRVLVPDGVLIDLRPLADRWRVEVFSAGGMHETGRVNDLPEQVNGDVAANQSMKEAEVHGWFQREAEEIFPYFYSWDTPSEMEEFIEEDWGEFIGLGDEAKMKTRSVWALADADSRVRIRVNILITRWRKLQTLP